LVIEEPELSTLRHIRHHLDRTAQIGIGVIERHTLDSVPPAVSYALSPLGQLMVQPIEMIYDWARQNSTALDQLQARSTSRRR
jgi:DNA-binding HxlR family transcriptional regulator